MEGPHCVLPSESAAQDLSSVGVCCNCVLRFLGCRDAVHANSGCADSCILADFVLNTDSSSNKEAVDGLPVLQSCDNPCIICLGILQTIVPIANDHGDEHKTTEAMIIEAVKVAGHQFDTFSLEVTVPGVVLVREHALWNYLQKTYGLEAWLLGREAHDHVVPLKEALKWILVKPLEKLLEAKFDHGSSFRVALRYKQLKASTELACLECSPAAGKRRKQHVCNGSFEGRVAASEPNESLAAIQRTLASMPSETFCELYPWPPLKCSEFCQLNVTCHRSSVYVGGRYLKFSRNISQTRWLIADERKGDGSVQEVIADVVVPPFKVDTYKFHAAGREDIDVRMLGSGRPFMLELINARTLVSREVLYKLQDQVNSSKEAWVKVRNLQLVGTDSWNLMLEGEGEKQKQYTAVIWLSRTITDDDLEHFSDIKELVGHLRSLIVNIIFFVHCGTA